MALTVFFLWTAEVLRDRAPAEHPDPARLPLPAGRRLYWGIELQPEEARYRRVIGVEDKKGERTAVAGTCSERRNGTFGTSSVFGTRRRAVGLVWSSQAGRCWCHLRYMWVTDPLFICQLNIICSFTAWV